MSLWDEALPKIDALISDHKQGAHRGAPVTACPSCLFTSGRQERPFRYFEQARTSTEQDHVGTVLVCACQWKTNAVTETRLLSDIADELSAHMQAVHDGVQQPTCGIQDPRVPPTTVVNYFEQARTSD